jgi:hypothetical protein
MSEYQEYEIFTVLILFGLIALFIFRRDLFKELSTVLAFFIVLGLLILPFYWIYYNIIVFLPVGMVLGVGFVVRELWDYL